MARHAQPPLIVYLLLLTCYAASASGKIGGWDTSPNTQYHIQTDEGPERFFRYQTMSGQYRKEKRLQDGSVVGSYGWVDADGFLRLRDYIADDKGYRIIRTKMVRVGQLGSGEENSATTTTTTAKPPISLSQYLKEKQQQEDGLKVDIVPNGMPSSTPSPFDEYVRPTTYRPYYNPNSLDQRAYASQQQQQSVYSTAQQQQQIPTYSAPQQQQQLPAYSAPQQQQQLPAYNAAQQQQQQQPYSEPALYNEPYDGVALTENGFRYYLPRHYHEEENLSGDRRAGSFGYVDPFGIRRVIYYNTSPSSGFVHRKNNRYVGFNSTPYDPRF